MARSRKKKRDTGAVGGPGNLSEYEQSMREFREVLSRAGHRIVHRLQHPRFIERNEDNQGPKPPRRKL